MMATSDRVNWMKWGAMQVDVITDRGVWLALRDNWQAVFEADPEAHHFLSWDWIDQRLAKGSGQSIILAARDPGQGADYVAFLPLKMRSKQLDDGRYWQEIAAAGSPMSDFTGFICRPGFEEGAIPALAHALLARHWGVLWLHCFRASEQRTKLFVECFPQSDFRIEDYERRKETEGLNNWICPYASLPDTWDAYLELVSANTRQKIRRFLRKVEDSDDQRVTHASADTIERDLDIMVDLWASRWVEKEQQASDVHRAGLRDILEGVHQSGRLILPILWQGDRPLGALALIADDKSKALLFYATGRDLDATDLPVGLILHAHSIRFAIAGGFKTYEFLRGDEPYKFSFATDERRIRNVVIGTRKGGNWGGTLDPLAIPVVFRMTQQSAAAGNVSRAVVGCRQVLAADPGHAGARQLIARLNQVLRPRPPG